LLPAALASGKTIIVPWCNDKGELELFRLNEMNELAIGMYKILEPKPELRNLPEKQCTAEELDIVMVPGVAFDRRGARMGHGRATGKLLRHARPARRSLRLAFNSVLPEIGRGPRHFMDRIISENAVYEDADVNLRFESAPQFGPLNLHCDALSFDLCYRR
jgi:5-formyltetrahydrofolate cyclo-ligase